MEVRASNPFDKLAIEILQHIGGYLDTDLDICRFRLICRSTDAALMGDNFSFWRRRFLAEFDRPADSRKYAANLEYQVAYRHRKRLLKHGTDFSRGYSDCEIACLEMLKDLIVDSFNGVQNEEDASESKNLQFLKRFIDANDLLKTIFQPAIKSKRSCRDLAISPTPLLQMIRVLCTPHMLNLANGMEDCHFGFDISRRVVYSSVTMYPIFKGFNGLDVDMEWILHNVNFWKRHMCRSAEHTLWASFAELANDERPKWWHRQLVQNMRSIGTHWKGSYAYVDRHEISYVREGQGKSKYVMDMFAGEDTNFSFQDMQLQLLNESETTWPPTFEHHLHSLAPPPPLQAKTRAQKRSAAASDGSVSAYKPVSFRFSGHGYDDSEEFLADGWLNALPPQQGVSGWQRMTMMKYFEDEDGIDEEALWAYEGVVLPGGQIALGRWWSPSAGTGFEMYSGPFILWCVDKPPPSHQGQVDLSNL